MQFLYWQVEDQWVQTPHSLYGRPRRVTRGNQACLLPPVSHAETQCVDIPSVTSGTQYVQGDCMDLITLCDSDGEDHEEESEDPDFIMSDEAGSSEDDDYDNHGRSEILI